ncbi:MAG: hypothetical protein QOG76_5260, partial [Pseudonocardiales bacterium]|nr:hypothetical protein [Pseudonocardiales bacterium]
KGQVSGPENLPGVQLGNGGPPAPEPAAASSAPELVAGAACSIDDPDCEACQ